ncbi:hypothetical protein [Geosporobacter ferrireducens]|uniref:Lipoprotein n=1 Tax=Geosporobacter ferrireducens TaxID=1424294 RepID=A0A1D8GPK4_9FIRM|nr:hypothetical protein [Geosporobacter ferrireducens]AOT72798.1 hypothetical protein Gferi_26515 [Geosporobacter ferrireducens]
MNKTKFIILMIVTLMILTVTGCSKDTQEVANNDSQTQQSQELDIEAEEDTDIIGVKADDYEIGEYALVVEGELIYFEGLGRDDNRVYFVERYFDEGETPPTYDDIVRNPQQWQYKPITFKAEVGHILEEEGNYYVLQMNTRWNNQINPNPIIIQYTKGTEDSRILPGDRMVFWGYSSGLGEFINGNGQTMNLPMASVNTMINTGSSVIKTTPAIKDFEANIVYYIKDGKNFITAIDSQNNVKWQYKEIDNYYPHYITHTEEGKIVVTAIATKLDANKGAIVNVTGEFVFDKEGNLIQKPEDIENIVR